MEVVTLNKEVKIGKEICEVGEALAKIVADAKAGKSIAEIAARNLQALVVAVEGFDKIDDEAKSVVGIDSIVYALSQVAKAILAPKPVA